MQQLNDFLKDANYQPFFSVSIVAVELAICLIATILLLHTLHVMGRRTLLYRKKQPVDDWNKRFYPASVYMIIFLSIVMWLLNVWSHRFWPTQ